jgi:hypothetical protein
MGTWIVVSDGEACERLSDDWFRNPSNTLELSLWIHSPGSGVTLLLRLGTTLSMVGWKFPCLQPVGVLFIKYKCSLLWFPLIVYLFPLRIKLLYLRLYL